MDHLLRVEWAVRRSTRHCGARRRGHTTSQVTQEGFMKGWIQRRQHFRKPQGCPQGGGPRDRAHTITLRGPSLDGASAHREEARGLRTSNSSASFPGQGSLGAAPTRAWSLPWSMQVMSRGRRGVQEGKGGPTRTGQKCQEQTDRSSG